MNKTFWEQWKDTIMTIIFFLVIAVCMVLIFYQFSKLLDKFGMLMDRLDQMMKVFMDAKGGTASLIPAT
jgi:hypothetical protein